MSSLNDFNSSENIITDFKEWAKKYHDVLANVRQELITYLTESQERNSYLLTKIQQSAKNYVTPSLTTSIDTMPTQSQNLVETWFDNFQSKTEQLINANLNINSKFEEETKRCMLTFYEMITKDEVVALKSYHEVEAATNELQQKMKSTFKKIDDIQRFLEILKKREQYFIQLKEDIHFLEPIAKEEVLQIRNENTKLVENLKSLNLNSISEATTESIESNELINEISNLKTQLNIQ